MKNLFILITLFLFTGALPIQAGNAPTMGKDELKAQMGSDKIVILDVRSGRDWSSSEFKIKGAIRAPGDKLAQWSANYAKDQTLVLYCA